MSENSGPSRIWYWVGGGIIAGGLLAAALLVVLGMGALSDEIDGFQRVPFGGSGEVSLSEGGYVLYHEGLQAPSSVDADVEPLDGGEAEAPAPYGSGLTYDLGGRSGTAVGTIRVLRPGRFRIDTTTTSDADGQLAVGTSVARRILFLVLGCLALFFGSIVVGATTLIVTAVKRQRARRY